jgi:hypothetical protein
MSQQLRNNENLFVASSQQQQQPVMLKRANVFGIQTNTITTTTTSTTSLHEPKQMARLMKPRMSRAPLASIQNRIHERIHIAPEGKQAIEKPAAASPKKEQVIAAHPATAAQSTTDTPSQDSKMMVPMRKVFQMESPGIDLPDKNDPQQVCEFVKDIFQNNKDNELKHLPDPSYMDNQPNITASMRATLVDWLVDVHRKYKLSPDTLFLTVNIMDRFLTVRQIPKRRFQLVGIVAMLIACKYEEISPPEVGQFEKICADAFTRTEILQMERYMLAQLQFNITVVTPYPFITRYSKCGKLSVDQQLLALYFAELTLVDTEYLKYPPSLIACSAIYLSNRVFNKQEPWCNNLKYYSGYEFEDISNCATSMLSLIKSQRSSNIRLQAVKNKYQSPTRLEVANLAFNAHLIQL